MNFNPIAKKEACQIEKALKSIHDYFSASGQSLCLAESLTGGKLSFYLSHTPGASSYFKGGIVSYQTETKIGLLGLSEKMIQKEGLSSLACAEAMTQAVKNQFQADWALAVTGFAGPKGGKKKEELVGKVAFAVQSGYLSHSEIKFFNSQKKEEHRREDIRHKTALFALNLLASLILNPVWRSAAKKKLIT